MIPVYKPWITELEKKYVNDAISSGWVSSQGPYIERFENEFADFIGCKHAIAVNNGTSACHLILAANGIGPGDEVIIPDITFIATGNAVKYCGATPVICSVDNSTWNIKIEKIESLITEKTKAIFCVHLLGNPCDYKALQRIREKYNILIIEDAAEALGASYNGIKTGNWFDGGSFSFFGNKTITTGEGGMVTTNDDNVAKKVRLLKGQGQTDRYFHPILGYNYRMTNIQAALGCAQLERIDEIINEKNRVFDLYSELLPKELQQAVLKDCIHGKWIFGIDKILKQNEVFDFRPMFTPLSQMPGFTTNDYFRCVNRVSMLPSYPELTNNEIHKICEIINE